VYAFVSLQIDRIVLAFATSSAELVEENEPRNTQ
jgi:hypothetical protein